jgi:Tol biopolymer transport system component
VVFVRADNTTGHLAVFRMTSTGHHVRRLTPWRLDADLPSVSPADDASSEDLVVFETYGHGAPDETSQAIATVPATCRSVARCAQRIDLLTRPDVQPVQNFNPTWSPSGRQIAYVRFKGGSEDAPPVGDIWTMRWNGKDQRPFATSKLFEFRPSWGVAAAMDS